MNFYDELRRTGNEKPKLSMLEKKELIKDHTYLFFKQFMTEDLVQLMKDAFKAGSKDLSIVFSFEKKGETYSLNCHNTYQHYEYIDLAELDLYFRAIPEVKCDIVNGRYICEGNLRSFVNYYYEELQKEEHFTR